MLSFRIIMFNGDCCVCVGVEHYASRNMQRVARRGWGGQETVARFIYFFSLARSISLFIFIKILMFLHCFTHSNVCILQMLDNML